MECAVCYCDAGPFQKLVCGHSFCNECVKKWYQKGTGEGCPMCRAPMYFRGFHKVRDEWNAEYWHNRYEEVFDEMVSGLIEEAFEEANTFPPWRRYILALLTEDLKDLERTARVLMNEGVDIETFEEILAAGDYYSDRHMNKCIFLDEPPRDPMTKHPEQDEGGRKGKRCRARPDEWYTVNFEVVFE